MPDYGDLHRSTMQLIISKPAITLPEYLTEFNDYCVETKIPETRFGNCLSAAGFDRMAFDINEKFTELGSHLKIKKHVMKEEDNKAYWVMVNIADDKMFLKATSLKPWQMNLFKQIVHLHAKRNSGTRAKKPKYLTTAEIHGLVKTSGVSRVNRGDVVKLL